MKKYPIIIITVIALLLPIIWLRNGLVIAYAESGFLFFLNSPRRALSVTSFTWWDKFSFGVDNIRALPLNSFFLLTSMLEFIGLSSLARQYLIFAVILLLSGLSMYYLVLELFDKKQWPAFFASLLFIFNPYTMNIWHRFTSAIFGLPLMPLAMLLTIKIIKKPSFQKSLLFAFVVLLFSVNAVNPGYFLPLFSPAILYALLFARKLKQWRYLILALVLSVAINFWWLLPLSFNIGGEITKASAYFNPLATLEEISRWLSLSFLARLIDKATIHWVNVNYQPGLIEWLIPILAIVGFFFHRKNKKILFFFGLWIVGLFFSKGLQPPGGGIFKFLFTHISAFQIFRSPFEKFGLIIAFSYAVLAAFGVYWLLKKIKPAIGKWVFLSLTGILLLIVCVWPMWSGDLFSFWQDGVPSETKEIPSVQVAIPQYWREAANYINQKKDSSRILFLPQSSFDAIWYRWPSGYWGCEGGTELLFDNPVISYFNNHPQAEQTRKTIKEKILNEGIDAVVPVLGLSNIKDILVRNDVNEIGAKTTPSEKIDAIMEKGELINLFFTPRKN